MTSSWPAAASIPCLAEPATTTIDGGDGLDTITAGTGDDVVDGGTGNDMIIWNANATR